MSPVDVHKGKLFQVSFLYFCLFKLDGAVWNQKIKLWNFETVNFLGQKIPIFLKEIFKISIFMALWKKLFQSNESFWDKKNLTRLSKKF